LDRPLAVPLPDRLLSVLAWHLAPNPTATPASRATGRGIALEDDVRCLARAVALAHLERDGTVGAPSLGPLSAREAGTGDRKPLVLVGEDEAVVLLLVEPEHLAAHPAPFDRSGARRRATRACPCLAV